MHNLTDEIFKLTAPYDNTYQGRNRRWLFVCSAGLLRSPTAAQIASKYALNTRSCGSSEYALIPISVNLLEWAHKIVFMGQDNFDEAVETFSELDRVHGDHYYENMLHSKSSVWSIADKYEYMNADLVALIEDKLDA
jgi:predicted protein tyrosine phosphatase